MSDSTQPFNIITGNCKEVSKKSRIRDFEGDIRHITNTVQMEESQVWSLGCRDFKQVKKNLEITRQAAARSEAKVDSLDKYVRVL